VLVVDGLPETTAVLKAVLEPRGLHVERLRSADPPRRAERPRTTHADRSDEEADPAVVVLHADAECAASRLPATQWAGTPRVIIGTIEANETAARPAPGTCLLPHPFDYRDLLGAIDRLLGDAA
jgi:CheY-like chemotaxis protein